MKRYLKELARYLPGIIKARKKPQVEPPLEEAKSQSTLEKLLAETEYDTLSAKKVVLVLKNYPITVLEELREYEAAHKNRKTVLAAIDAEINRE